MCCEQALWPSYSAAAAELGLVGASAFPLSAGGSHVGTFTVYRHHHGAATEAEWTDTALLAELAVSALVADRERVEDHLLGGEASGHYDLTAAAGTLCTRLDLSFDEAVSRLRTYAQAAGRPIQDLAADVMSGSWRVR
jgi:hypothetical protein